MNLCTLAPTLAPFSSFFNPQLIFLIKQLPTVALCPCGISSGRRHWGNSLTYSNQHLCKKKQQNPNVTHTEIMVPGKMWQAMTLNLKVNLTTGTEWLQTGKIHLLDRANPAQTLIQQRCCRMTWQEQLTPDMWRICEGRVSCRSDKHLLEELVRGYWCQRRFNQLLKGSLTLSSTAVSTQCPCSIKTRKIDWLSFVWY